MGRLWYVSEVQPPAFADGLCVEYEQKGRVMSDRKMFCLSSWKCGFAIRLRWKRHRGSGVDRKG